MDASARYQMMLRDQEQRSEHLEVPEFWPGCSEEQKRKVKQYLCECVAMGSTVAATCRDKRMPTSRTVINWLAKDPDFRAAMAAARELGADSLMDTLRDMFNLEENPVDKRDDGSWDPGHVGWLRESSRTLQWIIQKHAPKKYGDLLKVVGDKDHDPVQMSDTEVIHKIAYIRDRIRKRREQQRITVDEDDPDAEV